MWHVIFQFYSFPRTTNVQDLPNAIFVQNVIDYNIYHNLICYKKQFRNIGN